MMTDKHDLSAGACSDQQETELSKNFTIPSFWLRSGLTCPNCQIEILEYNGMLQLTCPRCGVLETGVFT